MDGAPEIPGLRSETWGTRQMRGFFAALRMTNEWRVRAKTGTPTGSRQTLAG